MIALLPALVMSAVIFGAESLILTGVCMLSAFVWERLCNIVMKRPNTTGDLSALVTGMILAFNLPSGLPYWMGIIGTFTAIVVTKQIFGGLGQNFANPAIVGRIVLMLSFTGEMTSWPKALVETDAVTSATPLVAGSGQYSYLDLFLGFHPGSLGEVCGAALIAGGLYLVVMRVIVPHIPLAFVGTVFVFSWIAGRDPVYQILSGGLLLGAIFMATDYVTSPITPTGKILFGICLGVLTGIFRFFGPSAEGVSYAIVFSNLLVPLIEKVTIPRAFGVKRERKGGEK
jgi:electron transport complex protein RnfD